MKNKLDQLLLHPSTRLQVDNLLKSPPQSLLISAVQGSGKKTLSKVLVTELLQIPDNKDIESYHYYFHIKRLKGKNDISIEQIRMLIDALKLKAPGTQTIKRVVFIEDAHYLSIPAQNALLKILEEPNPDTIFLLSANSVKNVLPTIASRTQKLEIQPVSAEDALNHWRGSYSEQSIASAWRLSGGSVGLLHALLSEDQEHELKKAVDESKKFLKSSKYQRLLQADQLSRNKEQFQIFIDALSRTLSALHHHYVKTNKESQSNNLLVSRKLLKESASALAANGNGKLIALKLVLSLKV
jgi:replication-associated recombination protein RarA